jgi:thymidylate synthase ThyX
MKKIQQLIGYYGSDIVHGLSAWTSTSRDLSPDKMERLPKLLMLARDRPHTPFEKKYFPFLVNESGHSHPSLKHRIGVSINGESARYTKELRG